MCPECGYDLPDSFPMPAELECSHCKTKLRVNEDCDFENGRWIDLTTFSKVEE